MSDVETHYDDDLDLSLDGFFEDESAVEEEVLATAAAAEDVPPAEPEPAEPGPSVGVTCSGK